MAPKSFYTKIPLEQVCNNEYKLQNASGGDLKIYGTRMIPFKLGRATIKIKFVICEVVAPLLSTNDLNSMGVSVVLSHEGSVLKYKKKNATP